MRSCTNSMFTYHKLIINSVIEDNWFVIHWAGAALRRSTLLYSLSGGCKVSSMSSSISWVLQSLHHYVRLVLGSLLHILESWASRIPSCSRAFTHVHIVQKFSIYYNNENLKERYRIFDFVLYVIVKRFKTITNNYELHAGIFRCWGCWWCFAIHRRAILHFGGKFT